MKKIKNFFIKKSSQIPRSTKNARDEKGENINQICRFKLMFNHATGKYEKIIVYEVDELSEDKA